MTCTASTTRLTTGRAGQHHHPWRSERGAFHLPSILVAVVVVGILTAGVLAVVFGVIPTVQDNAAQQDLSAVRTAEGTVKARLGGFQNAADLSAANYLSANKTIDVSANAEGTCYLGVARSATSKIFYSTHTSNKPHELTPTTPTEICIPAAATQAMADKVGGFDPSYFKTVGTGSGTTTDPGTGILTPAADLTAATATVKVNSLTITGTTVGVKFENTAPTAVTIKYIASISCLNAGTGVVTVEQLTGTFDVNGSIISGMNLVGCVPGTQPIDVLIQPQTSSAWTNTAAWRWNWVHPLATTVTRSVFVTPSSQYCIDNAGNVATNGNHINLAACADVNSQRWQWSGDGEITQSSLANKCLGVANDASTAAQPLVLWDCSHTNGQSFKAVPFQGNASVPGLIQMVQKSSGLCVDIPGGQLVAGTQLATAPCSGAISQSWYMPGLGDVFNANIPAPTVTPALVPTAVGPAMTAHPAYKTAFDDQVFVDGKTSQSNLIYTMPGALTDYTVVWTSNGLSNISASINAGGTGTFTTPFWANKVSNAGGTNGMTMGTATVTATATRISDGLVSTHTWNLTVKSDVFNLVENTSTLAVGHFKDLTAYNNSIKQYVNGTNADLAFAAGIDNPGDGSDYAVTLTPHGDAAVNAVIAPNASSYYMFWGSEVRPKDATGYKNGVMTVDVTVTHKTGTHATATKTFTFNVVDNTTVLAFAAPIWLWSPSNDIATYPVGSTSNQNSMFAVSALQQSWMEDYTVTWSGDFAALNATVTPKQIGTYNNKFWYLGMTPKTGGLTAGSITVTATMKYNPTGAVITKNFTMTVQ